LVPDDPLLFIGIFTVVVVACNVLLAWRLGKLAKAVGKLGFAEVRQTTKQVEPVNQPSPVAETSQQTKTSAFTPEQLEQLKMLIGEVQRGRGRPKGALDSHPRSPYKRRQPEASPPPETPEEDYIAWLENQKG
jgi:hypothetical protein